MNDTPQKKPEDYEAYLARIRRTIEESNRLVAEAELRIAETDRMLARQGLTREQVLGFRFTGEQRLAVNEELRRQGLPELEFGDEGEDGAAPAAAFPEDAYAGRPAAPNFVPEGSSGEDLENRRRKFGMMMKPFQL